MDEEEEWGKKKQSVPLRVPLHAGECLLLSRVVLSLGLGNNPPQLLDDLKRLLSAEPLGKVWHNLWNVQHVCVNVQACRMERTKWHLHTVWRSTSAIGW